MGSAPQWYRVVKAAQWLGTSPWDLSAQPLNWLMAAEEAQAAEAHAEKMRDKKRSGIGEGRG